MLLENYQVFFSSPELISSIYFVNLSYCYNTQVKQAGGKWNLGKIRNNLRILLRRHVMKTWEISSSDMRILKFWNPGNDLLKRMCMVTTGLLKNTPGCYKRNTLQRFEPEVREEGGVHLRIQSSVVCLCVRPVRQNAQMRNLLKSKSFCES